MPHGHKTLLLGRSFCTVASPGAPTNLPWRYLASGVDQGGLEGHYELTWSHTWSGTDRLGDSKQIAEYTLRAFETSPDLLPERPWMERELASIAEGSEDSPRSTVTDTPYRALGSGSNHRNPTVDNLTEQNPGVADISLTSAGPNGSERRCCLHPSLHPPFWFISYFSDQE